MARTRFTYLLTNDEHALVNKVAHATRCDESWFCLARDCGKAVSGITDEVYDMERGYRVSLRYGLKLLDEALTEGTLSKRDQAKWNALLKKVA